MYNFHNSRRWSCLASCEGVVGNSAPPGRHGISESMWNPKAIRNSEVILSQNIESESTPTIRHCASFLYTHPLDRTPKNIQDKVKNLPVESDGVLSVVFFIPSNTLPYLYIKRFLYPQTRYLSVSQTLVFVPSNCFCMSNIGFCTVKHVILSVSQRLVSVSSNTFPPVQRSPFVTL